VPLFGLWFGWKLARAGRGPRAVGRALGLTIAAFVLLPALAFAAAKLGIGEQSQTALFVYVGGSLVGIAIGLAAWPELGRTLLLYALAARVPVALVMLAAIFGNWGTHYDVAPPNFSAMSPLAKWFLIGFIPQMTIWIWVTIVIGSLFGIVAGLVGRRGVPSAPAAA
jgi:hypothetical protein